MRKLKHTTTLFSILLMTVNYSTAQSQSKTYPETRSLLIVMERSYGNKALKQLFEEADVRRGDLVQAVYDPEQRVSLNAQSVIEYFAEPETLAALDKWYEYRKTDTKEYWISPVKLVEEVIYLKGDSDELPELVLRNLHPNEQEYRAKMIAYNKRSKTALIEVVEGEIFTEGWRIVIRNEGGKWRLLSNYLVWQS
jgi:hypothetical protein